MEPFAPIWSWAPAHTSALQARRECVITAPRPPSHIAHWIPIEISSGVHEVLLQSFFNAEAAAIRNVFNLYWPPAGCHRLVAKYRRLVANCRRLVANCCWLAANRHRLGASLVRRLGGRLWFGGHRPRTAPDVFFPAVKEGHGSKSAPHPKVARSWMYMFFALSGAGLVGVEQGCGARYYSTPIQW